jgi:hypothetical protein
LAEDREGKGGGTAEFSIREQSRVVGSRDPEIRSNGRTSVADSAGAIFA